MKRVFGFVTGVTLIGISVAHVTADGVIVPKYISESVMDVMWACGFIASFLIVFIRGIRLLVIHEKQWFGLIANTLAFFLFPLYLALRFAAIEFPGDIDLLLSGFCVAAGGFTLSWISIFAKKPRERSTKTKRTSTHAPLEEDLFLKAEQKASAASPTPVILKPQKEPAFPLKFDVTPTKYLPRNTKREEDLRLTLFEEAVSSEERIAS